VGRVRKATLEPNSKPTPKIHNQRQSDQHKKPPEHAAGAIDGESIQAQFNSKPEQHKKLPR
jgi:hypothetical protein